jgi:hypothetical protein
VARHSYGTACGVLRETFFPSRQPLQGESSVQKPKALVAYGPPVWYAGAMKNLAVTALVVFACVAVISLAVRKVRDDATPFPLPDVTQIERVTARLFNVEGFGIEPVPEFEVARQHFSTLLGAISPAEKSTFGHGFNPIAELAITTKGGEKLAILVREAGINPVCFTVNGVDCIRGGPFQPLVVPPSDGNWHADESMVLAGAISEMHREKLKLKQRSRLKRRIKQLEISRGARPVPKLDEWDNE